MESAPLTLAHDHARSASIATQSSDTTVAINEHALAAGEFARAASGTGNAEALRTLRLLEQHHQRLSELLRYPTEHPPSSTTATHAEVHATSEKRLSTSAAVAELRASKSDLGPRAASPLRNPPSLQHPRRLPPRDLSSSIASNLASARGIRTNHTRQPLSPSISTQQAPGSLESLARKDGKRSKIPPSIPEHSQPSWLPPTAPHKSSPQTGTSHTAVTAEPAAQPTAHDEGFSKFYNAMENILYKLSAPLAFAGLPLNPEETKITEPESATAGKKAKIITLSTEPNLSNISAAALRASARDGHSGTDSFYVVPTSGQTVSYAKILSFAEKEKRRVLAQSHSNLSNAEDDDFVDARETPMPPTPTISTSRSMNQGLKGGKPLSGNAKALENRIEELTMKNQTLERMVDNLSKRVRGFELGSQTSSMALQESMRLMRDYSPGPGPTANLSPNPLTSPSFNAPPASPKPPAAASSSSRREEEEDGGGPQLKQRLKDLETLSQRNGKEIERLGKENEKLRNVVQRYRDRWEELKQSAKERTRGKEGGGKDAGNGGGGKDGNGGGGAVAMKE